MRKYFIYACLILCTLCGTQKIIAQQVNDSTKLWQIETSDGNKYVGFILSANFTEIHFRSLTIGEITIPTRFIVRKTELNKPTKKQENSIPANKEDIWLIETTHGNLYTGTIILQKYDSLKINTLEMGEITLPIHQIKNKKTIKQSEIKLGELWLDNPQITRYFWSPNGYGLNKGEGYYQNVWVWFNQASFGLTKNISLGFGMIPLFLLNGPTPIWITPKLSFPIIDEKINIGGGCLLGSILSEDDSNFGIAYGVFTYGSKNANFTIGSGWGMANGEWAKNPIITFSAMCRYSKRSYFLTENYVLPMDGENVFLLSAGGRAVWNRISLDYGLFLPLIEDLDEIIAFPWLGFVLPLGNK